MLPNFRQWINNELRQQLLQRVGQRKPAVMQSIKRELYLRINRCREFTVARTNREVASKIGPENLGNLLNATAEYLSEDVHFNLILGGASYLFGVEFQIVESSYNVLYSKFISVFKSENSYMVYWLKEILEKRGQITHPKFQFLYKPGTEKWSRTHYGIMVPAKSGGYEPPSEVAGVKTDNLIETVIHSNEFYMFISSALRALVAEGDE